MIENIEMAKDAIEKVVELPAMPQIMMKALELLSDLSSDVQEIQKQISADPALVAFVLKVANSPFYGFRSEISTISHAINLIGFIAMRSLLLSYLMKQVYQQGNNRFIQYNLWKHSLATAFYAKSLAREIKKINPEEAFIAGLMHDVGKAALFSTFPSKFELVVEKHMNEELSFPLAEKRIFEFTHIEVGYLLMKKWNFSGHLVEAEIYHHNAEEYSGNNPVVFIVSLANKLAYLNGHGFVNVRQELFEQNILSVSDRQIVEIETVANDEINKFLQMAG